MLQDTKKLLEAIRCTAERRAREAAAATADRVAAAVDRAAACEERAAAANASLVTAHESEVELAVLCRCLSEQEEENIDLEDTIMGLYEFLQRAREGPAASGQPASMKGTDPANCKQPSQAKRRKSNDSARRIMGRVRQREVVP